MNKNKQDYNMKNRKDNEINLNRNKKDNVMNKIQKDKDMNKR